MLRWIDILKYSRYGNPEPNLRIEKSEEDWKQQLSPDQYIIARQKGTESPYRNQYCNSYEPGQYFCICCNTLLFDSNDKYYAISGWPSFTQPVSKNVLKFREDESHNMKRIEVMCNSCDCHLGHVFSDGPEPFGVRYCINSACLYKKDDKYQLAIFGGGCFWSIEALFQEVEGVESAESGYSGGKLFNPTYREVSSGLSGHAEVVRVKFNPDVISYEELLKFFFKFHDPSLLKPEDKYYNQYRSIIIYYNEEQKRVAEIATKEASAKEGKEIFTEIIPLKVFYKAEEYHQNYYRKDPEKRYCQAVIEPKLQKLRKVVEKDSN